MADELKTNQLSYRLLRDTVSASESDLAAATKTWASFKSVNHPDSGSSAFGVKLLPIENKLAICFDFLHNNDTCAFSIYLYAEGGPAEFVCSVTTSTAGTQESDLGSPATNRYFCKTLGTITQRFLGGSGAVEKVDGAGDNGVAKIHFDAKGYKYILLLFTTVSGSDNVRAWFRGY